MRIRWIVLLALVVRLVPWCASFGAGVSARGRVMQSPDCIEYERAAMNLLDRGTLSISADPPYAPDSWRTPGYPLFIAGVYATAGRSAHLAVLAQIVLAALSCGLLVRFGERLVGARAAAFAGLAWALDVGTIANGGILLSEALCLFFIVGAAAVLAPEPRRAAAAGLLFALGALTRPAVLYLPVAAGLGMVVTHGRASLRPLLALGLAFALPLGIWVARNAVSTGVAEFSALEGQNLLFYRASGAMARVWGVPVSEAWRRLAQEAQAERAHRGWPKERHGALCKELALGYLRAHPLAYLPVLATGAVKAWAGLSVYDALKHFGLETHGLGLFAPDDGAPKPRLSAVERAALALDIATRGLALLAGAVGLAVLARRRAWGVLAELGAALVYVTLTAGTVVSYYRFRLPGTPFWCLLVGVALDAMRARSVSSDASCAASRARSASTESP